MELCERITRLIPPIAAASGDFYWIKRGRAKEAVARETLMRNPGLTGAHQPRSRRVPCRHLGRRGGLRKALN